MKSAVYLYSIMEKSFYFFCLGRRSDRRDAEQHDQNSRKGSDEKHAVYNRLKITQIICAPSQSYYVSIEYTVTHQVMRTICMF